MVLYSINVNDIIIHVMISYESGLLDVFLISCFFKLLHVHDCMHHAYVIVLQQQYYDNDI